MFNLRIVDIENFRLIKKARVKFPHHAGVVSVIGENKDITNASSNMAGKSTFVTAPVWCLYGCDLSGNAIAGDAVRVGEKQCAVECVFQHSVTGELVSVARKRVGTSTTITIKRKPKGAQTTDTVQFNAQQAQPYVDALFGSQAVFLAAHVFGYSELYTPFALVPDKQKKQLFDMLVDTGDLDKAYAETRKKHDAATAALDAQELAQAQRQQAISELKNTNLSQVTETQARIEALHAEYDAEVEAAKVLRVDYEAKRNAYTERLSAIQQGLRAAQNSSTLATAKLDTTTRALADALKHLNGNVCPTCMQPVNDATIKHMVEHTQAEIDALKKHADIELASTNAVRERMLAFDKEQSAIVDAARRVLQVADDKCTQLVVRARELKKSCVDNATVIRNRILELEEAAKDADTRIEKLRQGVAILNYWLVAFGPKGIRSLRLESVTPFLNARATHYSNALFGDGQRVRYATTTQLRSGDVRETFSLMLVDSEDKEIAVRSAGQSLRRDFINVLALSDLARELGKQTCSMLVLDEAFRTIDGAGIDAACALLQERALDTALVLAVEHNEEVSTRFDKRLVVVRHKGEASIRMEGL